MTNLESACTVAHHEDEYVISRDPFVGLLGMNNKFECLRCSPVMQILAILHDAYVKLRSEYGMGPGYLYAMSSCSRFSTPYLGQFTGIIFCFGIIGNFRKSFC